MSEREFVSKRVREKGTEKSHNTRDRVKIETDTKEMFPQ